MSKQILSGAEQWWQLTVMVISVIFSAKKQPTFYILTTQSS